MLIIQALRMQRQKNPVSEAILTTQKDYLKKENVEEEKNGT